MKVPMKTLKGKNMIDTNESLYLDTDCLRSMFCISHEKLILFRLFPHVFISEAVNREIPHKYRERTNDYITNKVIKVVDLNEGTLQERQEYEYLTGEAFNPDYMEKIVDPGEGELLALVKHRGGILGSDNLSDVGHYVDKWHLKHLTTCDLLEEAYHRGWIIDEYSELLWEDLKTKKRTLPYNRYPTFKDYLNRPR